MHDITKAITLFSRFLKSLCTFDPCWIDLTVNRFGFLTKHMLYSEMDKKWETSIKYTQVRSINDYKSVEIEDLGKEDFKLVIKVLVGYLYSKGEDVDQVPLLVNIFKDFVILVATPIPPEEDFEEEDSD